MEEKKENVNKGTKKTGDIIWTVVTVVLVAVAIYAVTGFFNQRKTGDPFFMFGYRAGKVLTGSMEEALPTGSIILIKETKDIEENDMIFFIAEDGAYVVHRYIDTNEDGTLVTKGDANEYADFAPVTLEQVQGKVIKVFGNLFVKHKIKIAHVLTVRMLA